MISVEKIFSHPLDFEYKRYLLKGYFRSVLDHFDHMQCYPHYQSLTHTYQQLVYISKSQNNIDASRQGTSLPFVNDKDTVYPGNENPEGTVGTVKLLLEYCEPRIAKLLGMGRNILTEVGDMILFEPVGILPLYCEEGYLIIDNNTDSYNTFGYGVGLYAHNAILPRIKLSYISTHKKSHHITLNGIKSELMNFNKQQPNPAVFYSNITESIPFTETALPASEIKLGYFLKENGLISCDL